MEWIVFALIAAITAAIVTTLSKAALKDIDATTAFAIQSVLILIVSWCAVFVLGKTTEIGKITGKAWLFLVLAGIITAASSLFSFRALKLGDASQVNPVQQMSFVFAILFAGLFLKEKITLQIIIGALLMTGGALLIMFSKK